MAKFQSLKGFRDFYPEDFAVRSHITDTWRRIAQSYGFLEYDAPPLESLDLYRHKSGDELVGQLYSFLDKGGREVAMRPEMTPSVVRMVAERWQSLPKPIKWFSVPQLFRYERPQAGRLREHFQFNVDVFGDDSAFAEADVLSVVIDAFIALGLGPNDIKIRLSDRRLLNRLLTRFEIPDDAFALVYSVLDKFDRQSRDQSAEKLLVGGLSEAMVERLFGAIDAFRVATSRADLEELINDPELFRTMIVHIFDSIDNAAEWIVFDLTIVRGLGYYTGTVFEAFDCQGKYRAICGGGRYDNLIESLGGPRASAVGMGWGDVVIAELLRDLGRLPNPAFTLDFFISSQSEDAIKVRMFAASIRKLGLRVDSSVRQRSRSQQSGSGSSNSARFSCVLHPDQVFVTDNATATSYRLDGDGGLMGAAAKAREGSAKDWAATIVQHLASNRIQ